MESVIVYKRINASDSKTILAALRDGYMALMPNGSPAPNLPVNGEAGPVIARRRRKSPRRIGPAPRKAKQIRNQEIVELKGNGWSLSAIGKRYGLSSGRVWQIVHATQATAKKPRKQERKG